MDGTIRWSDERGWYVVTDQYGDEWFAFDVDGANALLEREDSQRYYGATWAGDAGGADTGTIYPCRDGDVRQGVEEEYRFDPMSGWETVEPSEVATEEG